MMMTMMMMSMKKKRLKKRRMKTRTRTQLLDFHQRNIKLKILKSSEKKDLISMRKKRRFCLSLTS